MLPQFNRLTIVDQLFALLRIMVIIGGILWVLLSPLSGTQRAALFYDFSFFCIYSIILYVFIFYFPQKIHNIYKVALYLDLVFLFWLVRLTGGFQSDFYLAFLLLVALHAFYFGLGFGIRVVLLSGIIYILAGDILLHSANVIPIGLRISFFFLVALSMGLLSRKEEVDKQRIQNLNLVLQDQRAELEQEKNKLSNILMGIDAGLVLLNRNREIVWMNKISERWFGTAEEHLGKDCRQALLHGKALCKECPTEKSLKNGKIEHTEIELPDLDLHNHYFRITATPLFDEDGNITRILELIQDITEEKEMQLHLLQTSKLAAMGELASGVAHEINNPLSIISVCVQEISDFLNENPHTPAMLQEMQENVDTIKNEIQRSKRITTGLLDIARHTEHRRVPLDINHVVRNVRLLVRYKAQKEHKEIKLNLAHNLPMIMGESDTLSQVFLNLMLNAIEFTPAGRLIELTTEASGNAHISIILKDEGCGIPPQNIDKIFKPFFTTKPVGMGTGLGLPISMRIVRNHGGDIKVESQPNKGSTFTVTLPVHSDPTMI